MSANEPRDRDSLISARDNRRMFNRIAGRYNLLNRVLTFGLDILWRRRAIAELAPQGGHEYLDVGCGPGEMSIELCRQAPGARVSGVDPSLEMLTMGERKIAGAGLWDQIIFYPRDALDLRFDDNTYAGACSAFCLRNVEDQRKALSEMRRVIQPGSRVVVLELTRPKQRAVRAFHRLYNAVWVPAVGRILSRGSAYQYLVNSIESFPTPEEILAHMGAAGLINSRAIPLSGGIVTLFVGEKTGL